MGHPLTAPPASSAPTDPQNHPGASGHSFAQGVHSIAAGACKQGQPSLFILKSLCSPWSARASLQGSAVSSSVLAGSFNPRALAPASSLSLFQPQHFPVLPLSLLLWHKLLCPSQLGSCGPSANPGGLGVSYPSLSPSSEKHPAAREAWQIMAYPPHGGEHRWQEAMLGCLQDPLVLWEHRLCLLVPLQVQEWDLAVQVAPCSRKGFSNSDFPLK